MRHSRSPGRVVLLVLSPRVGVGLLTHDAWRSLTEADAVLAADLDPQWLAALAAAGVQIRDVGEHDPARRAGELLAALDAVPRNDRTVEPFVVWFGSPDGDPGLTDALAEHLTRRAIAESPPAVELLTGSFDVPGARLLDLVATMDQLRSPGGCPWDAKQTHASLLPYLLEETHEVIEAVESLSPLDPNQVPSDPAREHLIEELGDLLLQVFFHARIATEHPEPFDIDDVAAGVVAKLVRRHPHVFADEQVEDAAQVSRNWEEIKAVEKQRQGLFDGIPPTLPALARAQKMISRLQAAHRSEPWFEGTDSPQDRLAVELLAMVATAQAQGVDAEAGLRRALAEVARREDR